MAVGGVGQELGDQGLLLLVHGVAPLLLALGVDRRALADGVVAQPLADVAGVPKGNKNKSQLNPTADLHKKFWDSLITEVL